MNKPLVIYHADCTDGFGAAFAAYLKLSDEAEYLPMQYGQDIDTYEGVLINREIYILDFSFPRKVMERLFKIAKRVVWLDHHKSAFEMWEGEGHMHELIDTSYKLGSHIHLHPNKSGALLAWHYFHPSTEVPMLIQHIDDRDRWQFKLEGSKELHAALVSMKPWSFEQWKSMFCMPSGRVVPLLEGWFQQGSAILRAQDAHVKSMVKRARKCNIELEHDVQLVPDDAPLVNEKVWIPGLVVNCTMHMSEVGHELANQSGTFGLVWYLGADSRVKGSLRSNGDYDVSNIARAFGGGGHRNAAGFETDIETLMGWLK